MKKHCFTYPSIIRKAAGLLLGAFLCSAVTVTAQNNNEFALYLAPNATLYVNNKANLSVFNNVINNGTMGSVKGVTINMYGDRWRNGVTASFPDEWGVNNPNSFSGVGGAFRFFNSSSPQYLAGGFSVTTKTGGAFPNLLVANPRGLYLDEGTDTHILGNLHFEDGLLWLNGNNLMVGKNNPGSITGYTENRFVATGNTPKGGNLYRAKLSSATGSVVFPIGTQAGSYAPVSIMFNTATPQDLHARVFDNIYRNATIGPTGSPASLQQTWNIGQENNTQVPSIVAFQHVVDREGPAFTAHRGNSYVSKYDFTERTWDTLGPSGLSNPGIYTTGPHIRGAFINTRVFTILGEDNYLTKTADTRTDSITLAKAALTPVRQPDGSYRVTFVFLLTNRGNLTANTVQLLDTLDKVFPSPASFSVSSIQTSGQLVANPAFNGTTNTNLLLPASTLPIKSTDTVTLVLNIVTNKKEGYYYNTASLKGTLNGYNNTQYVFNNRSVNGLTAPATGAAPVTTPLILSPAKYQMQEGMSPNGDGINDKFVIGSLGNNRAAIWVFNKQGILVYRNQNYKNDWDGTNNQGGPTSNQRVEDGTYFYKVVVTDVANGSEETFYGYLSIWK